MLSQQQLEMVGQKLATLKIIVAALAISVLVFAVIVIVLNEGISFPQPLSLMSMLGIAGAAMMVPMAAVLPALFKRQGVAQLGSSAFEGPRFDKETLPSLLNLWLSSTIVGCAMLESAAFFNLMVAIIDKQGLNTIIAFVLVIFMAFFFPTTNRVAAWIDGQMVSAGRNRV